MRALIVEDEIAAARGLIKLLKETDDNIEVIETLRSVKEAIHWFKTNEHPPLVFMDIQLIDGSSFEIFQEVPVKSEVIFCTAYEKYAIQAFKVNCLHYLLKPIDKEDLQHGLERFYKTHPETSTRSFQELLSYLKKEESYKKRFLVKAGQKYQFVRTTDIAFFYTEEKLNFLVTQENRKHIIDEYLDELERLLDPDQFFRINRQYIISINAIDKIENDYGKYYLTLNGGEILQVSKTRVQELKQWLNL